MILTFDYNRTMQQAARMEESLYEMKSLVTSNYARIMDDIGAAWSGESSRQYLMNCAELRGEMEKTIGEIDELINKIRTTACKIKRAEESVSQVLSSGGGGGGGGGGRF